MVYLLSIHINDLAFYTTLRLHYARQCQLNLDLSSMFNWTYAASRARGCAAIGGWPKLELMVKRLSYAGLWILMRQ